VIGLVVLSCRRYMPESPRWLLDDGHPEEAERIVAEIERRVREDTGPRPAAAAGASLRIRPKKA